MKTRTLSLLYAAIIVGLLIWPVPHYWLTQTFETDPWKNMGLAMYATNYDVGVSARYQKGGSDWIEVKSTPETDALFDAYVSIRRTRGVFANPDPLAAALIEETEAEALQVQVKVKMLEGSQGRMRPLGRHFFHYDQHGNRASNEAPFADPFLDPN